MDIHKLAEALTQFTGEKYTVTTQETPPPPELGEIKNCNLDFGIGVKRLPSGRGHIFVREDLQLQPEQTALIAYVTRVATSWLEQVAALRPSAPVAGEEMVPYTMLLDAETRCLDAEMETERLKRIVHVPGVWRCAKCEFTLVQSNLNPNDGSVTARDDPGDKCPNDGSPLWRVSYRDWALENEKGWQDLLDRKDAEIAALSNPQPTEASAGAVDALPDAELIEELMELGTHPCRAHLDFGATLRQASERLAALSAHQGARETALEEAAPQDHWTAKALFKQIEELTKAGNDLAMMAETSGGTAGRDPALMAAIAHWAAEREKARQVAQIVKLEGHDPEIGAGILHPDGSALAQQPAPTTEQAGGDPIIHRWRIDRPEGAQADRLQVPAWVRQRKILIGGYLEQGWSAFDQTDGGRTVATGAWGHELAMRESGKITCTEYPLGYPTTPSARGDNPTPQS